MARLTKRPLLLLRKARHDLELLSFVSHDLGIESGFSYLHGGIIAVLVGRRHAHGRIDGRGWSWAVGSASRTGVVLAAAPAKSDT
jgi:hypothetical protein